jgi:hypothetical protein
VHWVVLKGENLFSRIFDGRRVEFAHMYFLGSRQGSKCRTSGRTLVLVVEDLSEMSIPEIEGILSFFDRRLPNPDHLYIKLEQCFHIAEAFSEEYHFSQPLRADPGCTSRWSVSYSRLGNRVVLQIWDQETKRYRKEVER